MLDEFLGRHAPVEGAGIALFEDHHEAPLDALVGGIDGGGDDVGERHAGNETGAFVDVQEWLLALFPLGHARLAAEHPGLDARKRDRLGQRERGADLAAVLAGLERRGHPHVMSDLLGRAAFVDWRKAQIAGQTAGGRPGIHPSELEGDQRHREILGPFDEAALFGIERCRSDAALVVNRHLGRFQLGPLVGIARPLGDHAGDRPARYAAGGLHEHGEVIALVEAPQDLADAISGKGLQSRNGKVGGWALHKGSV